MRSLSKGFINSQALRKDTTVIKDFKHVAIISLSSSQAQEESVLPPPIE